MCLPIVFTCLPIVFYLNDVLRVTHILTIAYFHFIKLGRSFIKNSMIKYKFVHMLKFIYIIIHSTPTFVRQYTRDLVRLRSLEGQQITNQMCLKNLNMRFLAILYNPVKKKILALKFEPFSLSFYRALHLKEILLV